MCIFHPKNIEDIQYKQHKNSSIVDVAQSIRHVLRWAHFRDSLTHSNQQRITREQKPCTHLHLTLLLFFSRFLKQKVKY